MKKSIEQIRDEMAHKNYPLENAGSWRDAFKSGFDAGRNLGHAVDFSGVDKTDEWLKCHAKLEKHTEALRIALSELKFYADEGSWNWHYKDAEKSKVSSEIDDDFGLRARAAISNIQELMGDEK